VARQVRRNEVAFLPSGPAVWLMNTSLREEFPWISSPGHPIQTLSPQGRMAVPSRTTLMLVLVSTL
jgi:hypothetical protein